MSSRLRSAQRSVAVELPLGSYPPANPADAWLLYLLRPNFNAVRALPNRSYARPKRGAKLFQFATFLTSGKHRSGTKRPAGEQTPSTPPLKYSQRRPPFTVNCLNVHESCT